MREQQPSMTLFKEKSGSKLGSQKTLYLNSSDIMTYILMGCFVFGHLEKESLWKRIWREIFNLHMLLSATYSLCLNTDDLLMKQLHTAAGNLGLVAREVSPANKDVQLLNHTS